MLLWLACVLPDVPREEQEAVEVVEPVRTAAELRASPPVVGSTVRVGPLAVISGPTPATRAVYLQDPVHGVGVEVRRGARFDGWPPPLGTTLTLRAVYGGPAPAPVLYVRSADDVEVHGAGAAPVVVLAPEPPLTTFSLARWTGLRITSPTDPTGRAASSAGFELEDRFRVGLPGLGNSGTLTGIVLPGGTVAPRTSEDWAGTVEAGLAAVSTIAAVRGGLVPAGAALVIEAVQATPWSRGDRYLVLQDADGLGLWLDAEGFSDGVGAAGQVGLWQVELRSYGDQPRLRAWLPRTATGSRQVRLSVELSDGALVERAVSGIGPPDETGERTTAEGWWLDDRFVSLDEIGEAATVRAAVEVRPDDSVRLAVLSFEAAP